MNRTSGWFEFSTRPALRSLWQTGGGIGAESRRQYRAPHPTLLMISAVYRRPSSPIDPSVRTDGSASRTPQLWCRSDTGCAGVGRLPKAALPRGRLIHGSCRTPRSPRPRSSLWVWRREPGFLWRRHGSCQILGLSFVGNVPLAKAGQLIIVAEIAVAEHGAAGRIPLFRVCISGQKLQEPPPRYGGTFFIIVNRGGHLFWCCSHANKGRLGHFS